MIDPGAEWVNHSTLRIAMSRSSTTLTISDKGLSTEISRIDLTSGAAKRHGMTGKSARDWRRRQRIDQRSKTRDSRARNLTTAMQFIRDRGDCHLRLNNKQLRFTVTLEQWLGNWP